MEKAFCAVIHKPAALRGDYAMQSQIVNHWSLISFARQFGPRMQVGQFTNSKTMEKFHSCIFDNGSAKTFVSFSSKLGELAPRDISARQDSLQVVQLENPEGDGTPHYCLCSASEAAWEDVELRL